MSATDITSLAADMAKLSRQEVGEFFDPTEGLNMVFNTIDNIGGEGEVRVTRLDSCDEALVWFFLQ